MKSKIYIGLLLFVAAQMLPGSAMAVSAVAVDQVAHKFGHCHDKSDVEEAKQCATAKCVNVGGHDCKILATGTKGGYSAIAGGSGQIGINLSSYEDEEMVSARALWECQQKVTGCEYFEVQTGQCKVQSSCKVIAKWHEPEVTGQAPNVAPPDQRQQSAGATQADTAAANPSPAQAKAFVDKGNALFKANRFKEAIAAYSQAIAAQPEHDTAYFNRGLAGINLSSANYANAWDDFSKAISLNPKNDRAYLQRGLLNKAAGKELNYIDDLRISANLGNAKAKEILHNAAASIDAEAQRRGKTIDPKGQGLNQAQINAMEMQRQLMWNATSPGMVYR